MRRSSSEAKRLFSRNQSATQKPNGKNSASSPQGRQAGIQDDYEEQIIHLHL